MYLNLELAFYILCGLTALTFIVYGIILYYNRKRINNELHTMEHTFETIFAKFEEQRRLIERLLQENSDFDFRLGTIKINIEGVNDQIRWMHKKIFPVQGITGSVPMPIVDQNLTPTITVKDERAYQSDQKDTYKLHFETIEIKEPFYMKIGALTISHDNGKTGSLKTLAMHEALAYIIENNLKVDPVNFKSVMDEFRAWMKNPIE